MIPFNKPYLHGRELVYIAEAVASGKISGDGFFSKKCQDFFEKKYGYHKTLLTTSCTDALEMAAILLNIAPGDEVIVPSFTFVSTANAFALRGARLVFADSCIDSPNIDPEEIRRLANKNTRAIVIVHYAGVACDIDGILDVANQFSIPVIEDAAQAVDSYYKGRPLGGLGVMGAFSFHETKNIISGEGGMLAINDPNLVARAEVIREKGTNRSSFFRGEVDKYGWVDIGSSFLPSDIISAYLYAQLENLKVIQSRRKEIWEKYKSAIEKTALACDVVVPTIPTWATNNGHMFYMVFPDYEKRTKFIQLMKDDNVHVVFHYLSLHQSSYFLAKHDGRCLKNAERYSECLVRLPLFYELSDLDVEFIIDRVIKNIRLSVS